MHFKIDQQLQYISNYVTLEAGDILMTGTPEGIASIEEGDKLYATLTHKGKVLTTIQDSILREK